MNHEIELKLQLYPESIPSIMGFLHKYGQPKKHFLINTYYDSPDHLLAKNKMGLRIRQQDNHLTLTLKTEGSIVAGLHSRPEYNLELTENKVDLNQLTKLYSIKVPCDQKQIQKVFCTNFDRSTWLVSLNNNAEIEVALDEGKIIVGEQYVPIFELELELKRGNVNDLFDFVRKLPLEHLFFCSSSKAKRGYLLAGISSFNDFNWEQLWNKFSSLKNEQKLSYLLDIEQTLIENLFLFNKNYFIEHNLHTIEYIMSFFNIFNFYKENAYLITDKIETLPSIQQQYFEQNLLDELLKDNQTAYQSIKNIILQHSQSKDNQQAIESLLALLSSKAQNLRLLTLMILNINSNKEE